MIAVDTTVLADLLFNDGDLRRAANLLQEIDLEWICLGLVRYELGNVAWGRWRGSAGRRLAGWTKA